MLAPLPPLPPLAPPLPPRPPPAAPLPPSPPPPVCDSFTVVLSTEISGSADGLVPSPILHGIPTVQCCERCVHEPLCSGFVSAFGNCYLKGGHLERSDALERTSYIRLMPPPPPTPPSPPPVSPPPLAPPPPCPAGQGATPHGTCEPCSKGSVRSYDGPSQTWLGRPPPQ